MGAFNTQPEEQPNPAHLEWCRQLIRITKDGAVWGIPRSGTTFRFDKQNKKLICVIAGNDDGDDFRATQTHFQHLGWTVEWAEDVKPPTE